MVELAPLAARELKSVTQQIMKGVLTVLLVEQNPEMCLALANGHYLMDHGLFGYHGTNEEFKASDEIKDRYLPPGSMTRELSEKEIN